MTRAERVYHALLHAYPAEFRAEYGRQLSQLFRDRYHDAGARRVRFWAEMAVDVARSAPALHMEASQIRWGGNSELQGGTMKTMAILAILIGAIEVVNSAAEAWVGGVVLHGGTSLAGGTVGALAGALLVTAAIALLRRAPGAAALAQGAAIACLAVFVVIALVRPMFSVFATILGIGFPIAMLLFLRIARRNGSLLPT